MKKQIVRSIILILSAAAFTASGGQTIRELWDHFPTTSLQGVTNANTSFGFYPNAAIKWTVNPANPAATNVLQVNTELEVYDWMIGRYDTLPASWTDPGSMVLNAPTNFDTGSWAVRFLDTPARINTAADGVYYFSARLMKRSLWWYDADGGNTNNFGPDDAALGIGFAAGSSASSHFVGAGFTRSVALNGGAGYLTQDGSLDIGDTVYITQGTLGQAGYTNHPADSGGPYYASAYGYPQWVEGYFGGYPSMDYKYVNGGFLVGKLTTSAAGSDQLQVYAFIDGESVLTNEADIVWDVSYSFNESSALNYLLVWMTATNHGGNACDIDAIRVGTTYADVIGVETFGPTADPTNRVYAGTPLTLSVAGYMQDTNATYQWLKGGSIIANATNVTYSIANPTTNDSGNFSAIYQNYFGLGGDEPGAFGDRGSVHRADYRRPAARWRPVPGFPGPDHPLGHSGWRAAAELPVEAHRRWGNQCSVRANQRDPCADQCASCGCRRLLCHRVKSGRVHEFELRNLERHCADARQLRGPGRGQQSVGLLDAG